jgi:predicted TIM-barrel fold metal-dependent hydrolase
MSELTSPDDLPRIISVDDHVQEPADLFTARLPRRWADAGPRVRRERVDMLGEPTTADDPDQHWADVWYVEDDVRMPIFDTQVCAGMDPGTIVNRPMTFDDMRPGCFDRDARLADMDVDGVEASLCFPNSLVRFCGQRFLEASDKELGLACVRAYNDWMVDEWAGPSAGRLIPNSIIPLWDAELAAAEVRRNAARGVHSVCFSEIPARLGLPSLHGGYWNPFFAACEETATTIQMHIGSSSATMTTSLDAPIGVRLVNYFGNASLSLCDWLLSGLFVTFPQLKIAFAEAQAGWIPYVLERLDLLWEQGNAFNGVVTLPDKPSTYFGNVFTCVFSDPVALGRLAADVGIDAICFETDYPHADGSWPRSKTHAFEQVKSLPAADAYKVVRGNAIRMLSLELV